MDRLRRIVPLALWLSVLATPGSTAPPLDFNRDVKPILSDKCFHCHGPDSASRQADLRLDQRDAAVELAAIVPGDADSSEMVRRILSDEEYERMPPPEANKHLTDEQKQTLVRWIQEGAEYKPHWSFVPIRTEAPPTADGVWARNEIDHFILKDLADAGRAPKQDADRERLIRRVSFDLTGLPPTLAEIDRFLADRSPDAYEKVVDRLLASPQYGERLASEWLDLARFADTHGYQADRSSANWPYRDWVIKAFNENLPFDKFIEWQLAGDLLPEATREQQLATAFNRLHMQNAEGGIVEEEFRVAYVADRVNTFGTAFLGLTMECCRCHDHKFDPLPQRDYYSLFAFFQNIDEAGQTSFFTDATPPPALAVPTPEQERQIAEEQALVDHRAAAVQAARTSARARFASWAAKTPRPTPAPAPAAKFDFEDLKSGKIANQVDATRPGKAEDDPTAIPSPSGYGVQFNGDDGIAFPNVGAFRRSDPFSLSLLVKSPTRSPRAVVLHHSRAMLDAGSRGYELLLEDGRVAFGMHHMWPENSLKVRTNAQLPEGEWSHVTVTYDGSSKAAGVRLYVDGQLCDFEIIRDGLQKDIAYADEEPDLEIGRRFRDTGFKGGGIDDLAIFDRELSALEVDCLAGGGGVNATLTTPLSSLSKDDSKRLFDFYLAAHDAPYANAVGELSRARKAANETVEAVVSVMVMRELPAPKPAYVLTRGAYDSHGEPVDADVPAALPPLPSDEPRNRLGLAHWLTSADQPLTPRVIVNRAWQMMFGRGIVETSENFGAQGSPPTHPELLDWLARDFISSGWNYKALLRKIALSSTYRQTSTATTADLAADPDNRRLARGPARRLTAEMLRDQLLADSCLLVPTIGGPSVKPYQPAGLWDVAMLEKVYYQGHGDDLYRRTLYTFWKRTIPPPALMTLDAADRSYCTARRQTTSTPTQALAMLNDVQVTEAARHVAERMMRSDSRNDDERLAYGFRVITGRSASANELQILAAMYREQRDEYAGNRAAAEALLAVGESPRDSSLEVVDLAAYTVTAVAIFNHDEALMRR